MSCVLTSWSECWRPLPPESAGGRVSRCYADVVGGVSRLECMLVRTVPVGCWSMFQWSTLRSDRELSRQYDEWS